VGLADVRAVLGRWVEILLGKFFSQQPTERLLLVWRLLGLDLSAGTVAGGLERIRVLYRQQRERLAHESGSVAFPAADAALRQTVAAMHAQRETELADPQLRSPCRKVLESLAEHWSGLTRFVDDRRIPLDNNASERQNRGPALGRKNYYGSGSLWSGRLAAMLFSLFATLQRSELNVRQWLTWYLQSCAEAGGEPPTDISRFLPWNMPAAQRQALALRSALAPSDSS